MTSSADGAKGLQYIYKWLITQAMDNWVITNIVKNDSLIVGRVFTLVGGVTVNYSLSK